MKKEQRLDLLLVETNHFKSRARAQQAIKDGMVVDALTDTILRKPSMKVPIDIQIRINGETLPYVSRGGLKLAAAIKTFNIDCTDKIVLDIGASTGGFTDVVLQQGAKFVYALDVGTAQLANTLREDSRVISLERTNFRHITRDIFTKGLRELIVTDVSFISLTLIIDKMVELFPDIPFTFIGLIKPQFELAKQKIGKKGVIRDEKRQEQAIEKVKSHLQAIGEDWQIIEVMPAPITGTKGNQEFLIYVKKTR